MFGEKLRQLRREHGLSQGELADRAGINRSYLSMVENGHSSPTYEVIEKLARGMGISLWTLLQGVSDRHFQYDAGEVIDIYDGLKEFLADADEMLLVQPTMQEVDALKGIKFRGGFQPDKRFYRDALLALRRSSPPHQSENK
jgi:transcriptional regulator with XRE-family HTH domain